jgi:2-amino-4-hydroxy-6-hydroxymethyldihydropteridine diphosphokinase
MKTAYLALGSNVGKRPLNLNKALALLKECGIKIIKTSNFYNTKPVSKVAQRDFLNMCVKIQTSFTPEKLLKICKMIEKQMGRKFIKKRSGYEKPRIIDIDILLYENLILKKHNLVIPHKKMHLRKFVLEPLNEIAPHLKHPVQHKTISKLLIELTNGV